MCSCGQRMLLGNLRILCFDLHSCGMCHGLLQMLQKDSVNFIPPLAVGALVHWLLKLLYPYGVL